jgi:hypothetical protein
MANKVAGCYLSTPHYGNQLFAECEDLYRVSNFGHSAKTCFAECRTRQNLALGKEVFAKPGTRQMQSLPRQSQTLGKYWQGADDIQCRPLCRVPKLDTRQNNFICFLAPNVFLKLYYTITNNMIKFGTLLLLFGIFL